MVDLFGHQMSGFDAIVIKVALGAKEKGASDKSLATYTPSRS